MVFFNLTSKKKQHSCEKNMASFQNIIIHYLIFSLKYVHFTCIHCIAFKSVWHSFEKVAFRTHMSPCERVWHCLSSCTQGTFHTYIYITIPSKDGYVSVRKCSMTPWNGHLNMNNMPCRKSSIILKRYSLRSSCTLRDHCIPWEQCGMPLSKFPWKWYNIVLQGKDAFGDTPCLEKNGPCESGRPNGGTVQQAGKTGTACLDPPLSIKSVFFCFWIFQSFF